jgi:hypothetical protein
MSYSSRIKVGKEMFDLELELCAVLGGPELSVSISGQIQNYSGLTSPGLSETSSDWGF